MNSIIQLKENVTLGGSGDCSIITCSGVGCGFLADNEADNIVLKDLKIDINNITFTQGNIFF
jgi:hypothetical protein